jgi:hypothetical protein
MSLLISIFLGAVYEYVMRASVSSFIPVAIIKDQFLPGNTGPEQFACNGFIAAPTTEAVAKKMAESGCVKIVNSGSYIGSFVPGFVKTTAARIMGSFSVLGNLSGISYISSSMPWINSSMLLGGGIIDLLRIDRLIFYIKDSYALIKKKKEFSEGLFLQTKKKRDEFLEKIKNLKVSKLEKYEQQAVYFGLASLIREANQSKPGSTKFKFGFVDFIEPEESENVFEMSITNPCNFLNFKPDTPYQVADCLSEKTRKKYISTDPLDIKVSSDNRIFIDSKESSQIEFFNVMKTYYSQMLLAHTFGIVWGQSARMKFINMNNITFFSNPEKIVYQIVFPNS